MNQILSVEMETKKTKKNKEPANIKSILKFFAISLIIFGIFLIGTGSYAVYKNNETSKNAKPTMPQISVENKSENTILLKVTHDKAIKEVVYNWNGQEKQTIDGENKKYIEKEIEIPSGTNTLSIIATDVNGQTTTPYKKEYKLGSMNIKIESAGAKVKISVESEKNISYVTYRWDDEDETTVNVNDTAFEQEIETIKGEHKLTVVAVDEDNNTETAEQKVIGVTKPKIEVKLEGYDYYVIKVTDEDGLSKVEFITSDGTETKETTDKEFEYKIPLKRGDENKLTIKAYKSDDITVEKNVRCKLD